MALGGLNLQRKTKSSRIRIGINAFEQQDYKKHKVFLYEASFFGWWNKEFLNENW